MEKDLADFLAALDAAIDSAMTGEIPEIVKAKMSESAQENVYNAYEPRFYSRRGKSGGVMDTRTMETAYDGRNPDMKVLEVSSDADWQQLWGGRKPDSMLADAIERGETRFNMGNAGPRPFARPAEREIVDGGIVDSVLSACLERDLGNRTF